MSEQLLCLFSVQVERQNGKYIVEIPEQELRFENIDHGGAYREAMLPDIGNKEPTAEAVRQNRNPTASTPPVEEGETRTVEINDIGDQGDGITRVERGFVVIVPDTEKGERVNVKISDVKENVAFANVVERLSHYD